LGLADDDFVVLFVGTLFDFSGLDLYLEQFQKVIEKVPNVKLLIVGGGALLERLKKRAKELSICKNVVFTGFQPFRLMPQYINLADVCTILLSLRLHQNIILGRFYSIWLVASLCWLLHCLE
jgi:glycosyltransferase involved in cell wall biosynthesis